MKDTSLRKKRVEHHRKVASVFSGLTKYWEEVYEDNSVINWADKSQIQVRKETAIQFINSVFGSRKLRILDAGCGAGIVMKDLVVKGHTVVGLDISREMVVKARKNCCHIGKGEIMCTLSDVSELPFCDNSFDVVVGLGLLEYVNDHEIILREFRRVLNHSGIVILSFPNMLKISTLCDPYFLFFRLPQVIKYRIKGVDRLNNHQAVGKNLGMTVKRFRYSSVRRMLGQAEFSKFQIKSIGFGPFTFWRKEIFSKRYSSRLSLYVQNLSNHNLLKWLKFLANRWVVLAYPEK